jgi:hypothetical protein
VGLTPALSAGGALLAGPDRTRAPGPAAFFGGFLAEAIGLRATAVAAGLGVVVAFVWIALSPVRSLRTLSGETAALPPGQVPEAQAPAGPDGPRSGQRDGARPGTEHA